jgi:hypothetical protein
MRWRKGQIQIKVNLPAHVGQIERTVNGYISGPFAIHRSQSHKTLWTLSHVPTKMLIVGAHTMRDAKIAAERFANFPADWDSKDLVATREMYDLALDVRRQLSVTR